MANANKIPIPEPVKEKLLKFGIKKEDLDNETAIMVSLYQQALKGNVSAITQIQKMFGVAEEPGEEEKIDITKEVEKEEKKILKNLSGLTQEQKEANKDFIHQLAFQSVTLKNLADDIAKNGVKEKYYNGANQWGYKDRTEVKTYNNMFKNYQSAVKQLNDLIATNIAPKDDAFDNFGENE
jgi:hypothetical protein